MIKSIKYFIALGLFFFNVNLNAQYTLLSQFGNLTECDTLSRGIFVVWWDKNWDYSDDAGRLLDTMLLYREQCLEELNMEDPPNPQAGFFYNVYLHHGGDIFPDWWGNGQGTDGNGYPYLTLPIGAHNDWVNVAHETFHVFQYSANAPGFSYSGDSQWYIEASANWYAAYRYKEFSRAFLEAESLVRLPHVPLWLSYDNFPADYPQNWQRYVHQYALALLLYYLTEESGLAPTFITSGLFSGTDQLPQEYFYNYLGADVFRAQFMDWAAHMTNHFDFLTPAQIAVLENEWNDYADPADDNEFIEVFDNEGSGGWYRPDDDRVSRGWAFNTYKLLNSDSCIYHFELNGDMAGSKGDASFFQGRVLVKNASAGAQFYELPMDNAQQGFLSLEVSPEDSEIFFIIGSVPEVFEDVAQTFSYEMRIVKEDIVSAASEPLMEAMPEVIGRYNVSGQPVREDYEGIQVILYGDGRVERKLVRKW